MLVDDDVIVAKGTSAMLKEPGRRAINTCSGRAALGRFGTRDGIDMVMTGYSPPGINGMVLATSLVTVRQDVPVIMATACADLPDGLVTDCPG